jgi:hypothetical protein
MRSAAGNSPGQAASAGGSDTPLSKKPGLRTLERLLKPACLVCPMVAAALFVCTAPAQALIPDPEQALRQQEAADKFQRDGIRLEIETNINRLKRCMAKRACLANGFPKLLLGLTPSEVEGLLGPPQYRLQLGGNDLYYWTVPLIARGTVSAVRVQVIYGDCYYREKNSHAKAVCEVTPY